MEIVDKRDSIFEINEIYKFKDLIDIADKNVIKEVIYDGDEKCLSFHQEFMKLVAMEIDHELNKTQFSKLKNQLISDMRRYLEGKKG
jgi:hypothetical protein